MEETILVVGAGIFGVSTAYHLAQRVSDPSKIIILDRAAPPSQSQSISNRNTNTKTLGSGLGASADINKIIRADYSSPLYMGMGFEAIEGWKTHPFFHNNPTHTSTTSDTAAEDEGSQGSVYHQSGWIAMDEKDSDIPAKIRENFRNGNYENVQIEDMTETQVRSAWGGVLSKTDYSPFGSFYYNASAGWVDAGRALEGMLVQATGLGVRYVTGEVKRLVLGGSENEGESGGVKGVETESGDVINADKVLLATGAWTSKVMASVEDELGIPLDDRVEGQVSAAGVCVAHYQLSEEEREVYSRLPVFVYGGQGEVIPPTSTGILKFTSTTSFKNTIQTPSGHNISIPIEDQSHAPRGLQEDCVASIRARLPQLLENGRKPDYYRLCWDSISASQHPLITRHPDPRLKNLVLAVGGSFHCYKFLPTIGRYVGNVLEGRSNGEQKDEAWSWKVNEGGQERGVHESLIPRREFKHFFF